jgi:ribosomal protein L25 (general stress protein Ctc)
MPSQFDAAKKAELILNQPLAAIVAINAIDCLHLHLIKKEPVRALLIEILSKLESSTKDNDFSREIWSVFNIWQEKNLAFDKRQSVSLENLKSPFITTVMSFEKLYFDYHNLADSARKLRSSAPTSKVYGKISGKQSAIFDVKDLTKEQVTEWVNCIIKLKQKKIELEIILKKSQVIWCTPIDKHIPLEADKLRSKLGLVHLPKTKTPASQMLICLKYDKSEITSVAKFKRPCSFDGFGVRFRALSRSEMEPNCEKPNGYGMTVDIADSEYADGEIELTFETKEDYILRCWNIEAVNGGLFSDTYPDEKSHEVFAKHLESNRPANSNLCQFRQHNDGIKRELIKLMSS